MSVAVLLLVVVLLVMLWSLCPIFCAVDFKKVWDELKDMQKGLKWMAREIEKLQESRRKSLAAKEAKETMAAVRHARVCHLIL